MSDKTAEPIDSTTGAEEPVKELKAVAIPASVTVGELAERVETSVTKLITELMRGGIMATVNQKIDLETAQIIVDDLGLEIKLEIEESESAMQTASKRREDRTLTKDAVDRPPVVSIMGHVDHGKTSLLDAIRESEVADGEAGGITQHISAYQVTHKDRLITFLDTPGHEAFAALRQHGADITDVAIIVVAADDGIKPQTKEAIKFAAKAGIKIIVAINKMDKEGADPTRVKQQLTDEGLQPEEWGGETVIVEVSAKTKLNLDQLLEMVLLVTDVEELKADTKASAEGLVIEAHVAKGRGAVATMLVENGTLHKGDIIVTGATYARIRTLENFKGEPIATATASTPVIATGFKNVPRFGDFIEVFKNEKAAKKAAEKNRIEQEKENNVATSSQELISLINDRRDTKELPIIVKGDVQGSLKSVIDALKGLSEHEVRARVISSAVGGITENDIALAHTSGAIVYGFGVDAPASNIRRTADRDKVKVRIFNIIYELIDDAKEELSAMLEDEVVEKQIGELEIKGIFRTTQKSVICGGEVQKGVARPNVLAHLVRKDDDGEMKVISEVRVESVKRQEAEVKEVSAVEMCGLQLGTEEKLNLKIGDRIHLFTREIQSRSL